MQQSKSPGRSLWFAAGIGYVVFLVANTAVQSHAVIHPEAKSFIVNYLDDRGFLQKIFDPKANDWDQYQGRELSYFFDNIDVHFIALSAHLGVPHFYSLTHFICLGLIFILFVFGFQRIFGDRYGITSLGVGLLLLTDPTPFLSSYFFRSAKITVALSTLLLLFGIDHIWRKKRFSKCHFWFLVFFAALQTLLDRQGLFITGMLSIACLISGIFFKERIFERVALGLMGATIFGVLYNYYFGPWLIQAINHYPANFTYQGFHNFRNERHFTFLNYCKEAMFLFLDQVVYLFGNPRWPASIPILALLGYLLIGLKPQARSRNGIYFFLFCISVFIMNLVMLFRHQDLVLQDVKRTYYWSPLLVFMIFGINLALGNLIERKPGAKRWVEVCVALILLANIRALPRHLDYVRNNVLKEMYKKTPLVVTCILGGSQPEEEDLRKVCITLKLPHKGVGL